MKWYAQEVFNVIKALETDAQLGLRNQQVAQQQKKFGINELPSVKQPSIFLIFFSQFTSPLIYILLVAAILIFIFGHDRFDAFVIMGVLSFNAILGTVQEWRTHLLMERLRTFAQTDCVVIRDGKRSVIPDNELVVGDIIIVQAGQRVPADARLIEVHGLQVDEAILTGESGIIYKKVESVDEKALVADQTSMLFKGSYILAGSAHAVVVAVGLQTELGKLAVTAQSIDTRIPLRDELNRLSYWILILIFIICSTLFVIGLFSDKPLIELFTTLIALFICVIPEGLPIVLTLVLVNGVYQMAKKQVLVKNMQAVETLGRTHYIIVDKTGTLTRNEMMVTRVYAGTLFDVTGQGYAPEGKVSNQSGDDPAKVLQLPATIALVMDRTELVPDVTTQLYTVKGDPTEAALYIFARKVITTPAEIEQQHTLLYEIPFDQTYKYHAALFEVNNQVVLYCTGAPDNLIVYASENYHAAYADLLQQGLRVIGIASHTNIAQTSDQIRSWPDADITQFIHTEIAKKIELHALCGIEDAVRTEVAQSVTYARNAGLHIIMATGDHKETALHVARATGIFNQGDGVLTGKEVEALSDEQLKQISTQTTVFARLTPQHKMRLIHALQQQQFIVAMTGDGINDVPALAAADLGIAMGKIGTEVTKEAGDLVLLDDSLASIIDAIAQGRHIFYILKQVILYFFSTNLAEVCLIFFVFLIDIVSNNKLPLPLTAVQILWLNLVTDGFLDMGISMEPQEPDLLKKDWLQQKKHLIDKFLIAKAFFTALIMSIGSLLLFAWAYRRDIVYARTMVLITMAMYQWFNAWNCRSERISIVQRGIFSNRWLIAASLFVLLLQAMILYIPFLRTIFKTMPLSLQDWFMILAVTFPIILIEEVRKWIVRRYGKFLFD